MNIFVKNRKILATLLCLSLATGQAQAVFGFDQKSATPAAKGIIASLISQAKTFVAKHPKTFFGLGVLAAIASVYLFVKYKDRLKRDKAKLESKKLEKEKLEKIEKEKQERKRQEDNKRERERQEAQEIAIREKKTKEMEAQIREREKLEREKQNRERLEKEYIPEDSDWQKEMEENIELTKLEKKRIEFDNTFISLIKSGNIQAIELLIRNDVKVEKKHVEEAIKTATETLLLLPINNREALAFSRNPETYAKSLMIGAMLRIKFDEQEKEGKEKIGFKQV